MDFVSVSKRTSLSAVGVMIKDKTTHASCCCFGWTNRVVVPFIMAAAEGDNIVLRFTYTGADDEVIPYEATHILVQARVIRRNAFHRHQNIVEVICNKDVEKIEADAFCECPSLKRVIMPGVKIVEEFAFIGCTALEYVECDKLEIIGDSAFFLCDSLRSISLPSARIVQEEAFNACYALKDVNFGKKLERMERRAFCSCKSLERITIPLKDGLIASDHTFVGCYNLRHVHLVEGEMQETIVALQLEEWRNDMNQEIGLINQTLPNAAAGGWGVEAHEEDLGEKARTIRSWIRSVLRKITNYQDEHRRLLNEVAMTLQLALPNEIVMNNVLSFLNLPPYTFEVNEEEGE